MDLGHFSISLSVKNIQTSKHFYEKLGFSVFAGDEAQNWLIMKNGKATIGLFQGMFEKNILTFNPGWNDQAEPLKDFTDIRLIQNQLKERGLKTIAEVDEAGKGPGSFMLIDPDGNTILIDQHI